MYRPALPLIAALLALPLLAAASSSAHTQDSMTMPGIPLQKDKVDDATREKREKIDQEYRAATGGRIQSQENGPRDPWANMRGAEEKPAPAAKPKPVAKKPASASTGAR